MLLLQDLHIGYKNQVLAQCIGHIAFAKAKFIAIIGANGTGKSTLLRAIASGDHIIQGNVVLDKKPIASIALEKLAQRVSILTTERNMSQSLTVRQLLEITRSPYTDFLGRLGNEDQTIIESTIQDFELQDLENRPLHQLSDGQVQRALIARCIVQDTEYILMDEPTNHLDLHHKAQLLSLLKSYTVKQNKTIIFSTHEIAMATALADQVLYFHDDYLRFKSTAEFMQKEILKQLFPSPLLDWNNGSYSLKDVE
ncbi:ABC transporter ATP-binding protein [Nonlabens ponticola]|nr:ABC transporter ATP-binding protein [Nonlabens ponticola]